MRDARKETDPGSYHRGKVKAVAGRYLAAIERVSSQHQSSRLVHKRESIQKGKSSSWIVQSPRSRSSHGRSVKSAKTSITIESFLDPSSGSCSVEEQSWNEVSPSRGVNSSQDLTTPGSTSESRHYATNCSKQPLKVSSASTLAERMQFIENPRRQHTSNDNHCRQTRPDSITHNYNTEDESDIFDGHASICSDTSSLSSPQSPDSVSHRREKHISLNYVKNNGPIGKKNADVEFPSPPTTQGFLKKSIDRAVHGSLDLILDNTAWANCNTSPISIECNQIASPNLKRHLHVTKCKGNTTTTQETSDHTSPTRTPSSHSHSNSRNFALKLSQSFSTSSMHTEAATEVATNRAIDLAMKRIREIEKNGHTSLALIDARKSLRKQSPVLARSADRVAMGAKSLFSSSSNESSRKDLSDKGCVVGPVDRLGYGRLLNHVERQQQSFMSTRLREEESSVSKSLSSSLGVEFSGAQKMEMGSKRNLRISGERVSSGKAIPNSKITGPSLTNGYNYLENVNLMIPSLDIEDDYGDSSCDDFGKGKKPLHKTRTYRVPTPNIDVTEYEAAAVNSCLSPRIILRRTQSYEQKSPDPIFCTSSMSFHSSSAGLLNSVSRASSSLARSFGSEDAMIVTEGSTLSDSPLSPHTSLPSETSRRRALVFATSGMLSHRLQAAASFSSSLDSRIKETSITPVNNSERIVGVASGQKTISLSPLVTSTSLQTNEFLIPYIVPYLRS
jgi:hypothetical protein